MQPPPDDGDRLERRSLTGTARLRRAMTYLLHAGVAGSRLPHRLARGRQVVAALRAACRSETGAPSPRTIRSRGVPAPPSLFMPAGVRSSARMDVCCVNAAPARRRGPLGAPVSDRHRPPPAGDDLLAARRSSGKPPASPSGPRGAGRCGPPGRVSVRDRRSKHADHQIAWGSGSTQPFHACRGAQQHAHGRLLCKCSPRPTTWTAWSAGL